MNYRNATIGLALLMTACSGDPAAPPTLEVNVFGWDSAEGFVSGLPSYDDAQTIRTKVTQPNDKRVVSSNTFPAGSGTGSLPEVPFGLGLRLDFEVLDSAGDILASGATPTFDFEPAQQLRTFRLQVAEVNDFAPVGNVVVDRNSGERKFAWSRFDYRGKDVTWLGRSGHATAPTEDGRVLVVGGGDPVPGAGPGSLSEFREVYTDIQIFDPETGYFTDLAYDEGAGSLLPDGRDQLFEPVVHHSVTAIGGDKFIVVGGFTPRSEVMRPVNTIQIIDLGAEPGMRVQRLVDADGSSLVLRKARGWHTATFRDLDDHIIIAGGIGPQGEDDILDTFEMIDVASSAVYPDPFDQQAARADHEAVLMGDGRTVWLIGGRDASGAVSSTEVIRLTDAGMTESDGEASMRTARFGLGAVRITPGDGELVVVAGGFTDLDGAVDDSFEVSKLGRGSFETGTDWKLETPRGGIEAVEVPQSLDVILIGGRGDNGMTISTAERLAFLDLTSSPPYEPSSSSGSGTPRYRPSVNLLSTGRLLLIGGEGEVDGAQAGLDSADIYNPLDPVGGEETVVVVSEDQE